MFVIDTPPVASEPDPLHSFEERAALLKSADVRVVYLCEHAGGSSFRYRVANMIEALKFSDKKISGGYFTEPEFGQLAGVLEMADVIVVCRARYSDLLKSIVTQARGRGKSVIFDVDDLIYDVRHAPTVLQSIALDMHDPNREWQRWFVAIAQMGATLQLCDRVITTNNYLATKIREWSNKRVDIIPNFLNNKQLEISRRIFKKKKENNFKRGGQTCLGYFSGSPTHNKDFAVASAALAELLERNPKLTVQIVGYLELQPPLDRYKSRIQTTDYVDYVNLQRLIGAVEVNLVPLQDNAFCQSKSELKYFEAAIVGTLSVASPTYAFTQAIDDNETGMLANEMDWAGKIQQLLDSMDRYPQMAQRAFDDVEARYTCHKQTTRIENILLEAGQKVGASSGSAPHAD